MVILFHAGRNAIIWIVNCNVIPRESLTTQDMILVMDVRVKMRLRRNCQDKAPKIWCQLKRRKTNYLSEGDFVGRVLGGTRKC